MHSENEAHAAQEKEERNLPTKKQKKISRANEKKTSVCVCSRTNKRHEYVTLDIVISECIVYILCWGNHKSFIAFRVLYETLWIASTKSER